MAKIVVANLGRKAGSKTSSKTSAVSEKRVRGSTGQLKTLRTLDAGSQTFGDDLRYVFGKNVEKARRDNKRAIGSTDLVPAKR